MSFLELNILAKNLHYKNKESWEQTRLLAFISASPYAKKGLKINDIISFDWDDKPIEKKQKQKEITDADILKLKKEAEEIKNKLNNILK